MDHNGRENILPSLPAEIDFQNLAAAASSTAIPVDREIDISFFSHKSRKSTRLIGNTSGEAAMRARREWLSFDLNDTIYITSIKVLANGYDDSNEMELSIVDAFSDTKIVELKKYGGKEFSFEPKRFIRGFGLRPDSAWLKSVYVTKIEVRGIEQKYFFEVVQIYENLNKEKTRIETELNGYLERAKQAERSFEENKESILRQEKNISVAKEEVKNVEEVIGKLHLRYTELRNRIEIGSSVEKERNERVQAIEININNINDHRKTLSLEVANKESYLRELKNNINLFPTEIAGYVNQGTRNINLYFVLTAAPLAIVGIVTYRLFANAEKLLNFNLANGATDILEYLISRTPYVAVSGSILGICYSLVRGLVAEIVNINRRRQELYKISIIATDVSYASQDDMKLDDEQRYNLRTQTKMEMLKEHLKMNLGDDFAYAPKREYLRKLGSVVRTKAGESEDDNAVDDDKQDTTT